MIGVEFRQNPAHTLVLTMDGKSECMGKIIYPEAWEMPAKPVRMGQ